MQHTTITWQQAGFSKLLIDYVNPSSPLQAFYTTFPSVATISREISLKKFSADIRATLCQVITEQYAQAGITPPDNLRTLELSHSRTVTTGHQLCLMTGRLYFVYKIITTLQLARELTQANPDYPVVPIFWLASEDHDFAEVNHFQLFGKKYEWQDSNMRGAVGRYAPQGIEAWLDTIPQLPQAWKEAYTTSKTWAEATRKLVHTLFGEQGILVLDADDVRLKQYFTPYILDDLAHHTAFQTVSQTTEQLERLGYKSQIHPRPINLFYLQHNLRTRIEKKDNQYEVLQTDWRFDAESLRHEVEKYPDRFSPNVVLRPLYQEIILPNVAYVGGPAEIAYWLQLSGLFKHYGIRFPALVPRNSGTLITPSQTEKIKKLGLTPLDMFGDIGQLKKRYTAAHSQNPLTYPEQRQAIHTAFEQIARLVSQTDASLVGMVQAEMHKALKAVEHIEKKVEKSAEQQQATQLQQLSTLLEKLFPNQTLQERHDNILSYLINHPNLLETLQETFNPFEFDFKIIELT